MLMVFHRGTWPEQYEKTSVMILMEGFGGKMYVPLDEYSFRMSFWIVPVSFSAATPVSVSSARMLASGI